MRILMIGWELPPFNSGGLGEACYGLSKALTDKGLEIIFVLPKKVSVESNFMKVVFANVKTSFSTINVYETRLNNKFEIESEVPPDYVKAALAYAEKIKDVIKDLDYDVIHSHDWLTLPAAIAAKKLSGKPLIAHVHATEFDRTGGGSPNPYVYKIEKEGLAFADRIVSVSEFTKNVLVQNYNIDPDKVIVVHNGVSEFEKEKLPPVLQEYKEMGYKIVLFLGRITLQKGPDYFVKAAKMVLEKNPKVIFVVAGSGDMLNQMVLEATISGISDNFIFTGFIRGAEKDRVWQSADLYVMPSVSEPFGLTALESVANGTPVLISKQSGVSEVLSHALKVDFWDTDEMANKILAAISYDALCCDLRSESKKEIITVSWDQAAESCKNIYRELS